MLHDEGLTRYYELRGAVGVPVVDPGEKDRTWLEPIEAQLAARGACDLDVSGIHCSACVWVMEELFRRRAGAGVLELNPTLGRMHMRVGEDFSLRAYLDEVERLGYRFGPPRKRMERASDTLLLRTGVVMALAANSMIFSIAIYLGLRSGPLFELLSELSYGAGALSVLVGGGVFFQAAWRGLRARVLHLDLPIAAGIALAFMGSSYSFFFGSGEATYVDTLTVFIALMLLGRFLQERTLERNRDRLLADEGVEGLTTRRRRDGKVEIIACVDIAEGDTLVCAPGDLVPVDALLLSEHATLSLDWIDGESAPSYFSVSETLPAGAFNAGDHAFSATATSGFEASCVLRLLNRTSAAGEERPASSRFWQRVSGFYVIFVLAAALTGAVYWFWTTGDGVRALEVATAILVVTCPCSFGIAVPLGYEVVRARLRRLGLFVRTRSLLDRMRQVRRVVFDKTGTLTTGALVLADTAELDSLTHEQADRLYGMASQSSHPKARALAEALEARGASWRESADTGWAQESAGLGLCLRQGGHVHRLGSALFALGADTDASEDLVYSLDGEPVLSLTTREDLRPGARAELERLESAGYDAFILSGDRREKVRAMAERLGLPAERALGEQRPEAKAAWVRAHAPEQTLMLGDGLNDGLVVREALCSGTPAIDRPFMASRCDFYLVSPGLGPIAEALRLSRLLGRVVRVDLAFALLYNSFAVGLAMAGLMRPWLAAILMPASSLVTIALTLLALRERRALTTVPAHGRPAWT